MKPVLRVSVMASLILFGLLLTADVVYLKTGEKLEGKIILEDDDVVILKKEWGQMIVKKEFIKSIERKKEKGEEAHDGEEANEEEAIEWKKWELRLKSRLETWMRLRKKLECKSCGGDGREKCPYCKGTGQQPADPHSKTMRG